MNEFDCEKFKRIVKSKFGTYDKYVEDLNSVYGLDKKVNTVQKWGQKTSSNVPTAKELPMVAESLNIEIIDMYINAKESRQKITIEEITKDPSAYLIYIKEALVKTDDSDELMDILQEALQKG